MTYYIPAYDVEYASDPDFSIEAVKTLTSIHRRLEAPATFFLLGKLIEKAPEELRDLLDYDLFDLQSHTYSHKQLKDSNVWGKGVSLDAVEQEVSKASSLIESVFNRSVVGLRPGGGFHLGFKGCTDVLGILWRNGIRFASSQLRGPLDTVPGPLAQPYWYKEEGYQALLEMPGHDWHDCVLIPYVKPFLTLWPPIVPGGLPSEPPTTPKEVFQVYRPSIDYAVQNNLLYYSPVFHPWSICRFDRKARIVSMLLRYVKKQGMEIKSYHAVYSELKAKE